MTPVLEFSATLRNPCSLSCAVTWSSRKWPKGTTCSRWETKTSASTWCSLANYLFISKTLLVGSWWCSWWWGVAWGVGCGMGCRVLGSGQRGLPVPSGRDEDISIYVVQSGQLLRLWGSWVVVRWWGGGGLWWLIYRLCDWWGRYNIFHIFIFYLINYMCVLNCIIIL